MKRHLLISLFSIFLISGIASGESVSINDEGLILHDDDEAVYHFPEIKPEVQIRPGFWYADHSGPKSSNEYEYLENTASLYGRLIMFPFPHRVFLNLCVKNTNDYCADFRYAYGNLVLARFIDRTFHHNLGKYTLIDPDSSTKNPGIDIRDAEDEYGITGSTSSLSVRFKAPDFPLHLNINGWRVKKNGTAQQRSLIGSGYYNDIVRISQSRDIDNETLQYSIGANSHLGPIEAEISHAQRTHSIIGDGVLTDNYTATAYSAAGAYEHNLIPELKGSTTTFKIHTDYTGRLVGSATVSKKTRENSENRSTAEYFSGSAGLTWIPVERLNLYLRYNRKDKDADNPDNPTKPSISTGQDTVSLTFKYRLLAKTTVRAGYSFTDIRRDNADLWGITDSTRKHIATVTAYTRVPGNLGLRANYTYKHIADPAYYTDPDNSDEGSLSLTWTPFSRLNAVLGYSQREERRKDPTFDREAKVSQINGNGTLLLLKQLSMTVDYANIMNKVQQDISYAVNTEIGVPYEDKTDVVSVGLNYMPVKAMNLHGGITYSQSKGSFAPKNSDLLQPVSIASFSKLETAETGYSLSGSYKFKGGLGLKADYNYSDLDDIIDNPYDDVEDGNSHAVLLTASMSW